MISIADAVRRIKDDPFALIDPSAVTEACARVHLSWRNRVLTPVHTLAFFALQILHGNTAIAHVARLAGGGFSESAYCQARQRIPTAVFRDVLHAMTSRWLGDARASTGTWKGHRTFTADGTGCDMPETPDLQTHFGQPTVPGPGRGFPVAHVLTLFDAASGLLLGMPVSRYATHDMTRISQVYPHLSAGDVLVTDRGICSYVHLAQLTQRGVHAVCRAHASRPMPYPAPAGPPEKYTYNRHRHKVPILVETLGEHDQVVALRKPHNRPGWMRAEDFAAVPSTLVVRVLKYRVRVPGFRTREVELMTTLRDAAAYPAADLAALYMARWRIEVNLRSLKQTLGMTSLHCRTVEGVTKELLMFALAYNAVRMVMLDAAKKQGVDPERISFVDALRWMLHRSDGDPPPMLKVNPYRPGRIYARVVKRSVRFPKLLATRADWKQAWDKKHAN